MVMRNAFNILHGKTKEKRPLGRCRRMGEDITSSMDFKEIGCEGVSWIQVAQDWVEWRVYVNTVMNFRVPSNGEGGIFD
jgi:hypothetical protein